MSLNDMGCFFLGMLFEMLDWCFVKMYINFSKITNIVAVYYINKSLEILHFMFLFIVE